jgi:hypothetical protein
MYIVVEQFRPPPGRKLVGPYAVGAAKRIVPFALTTALYHRPTLASSEQRQTSSRLPPKFVLKTGHSVRLHTGRGKNSRDRRLLAAGLGRLE